MTNRHFYRVSFHQVTLLVSLLLLMFPSLLSLSGCSQKPAEKPADGTEAAESAGDNAAADDETADPSETETEAAAEETDEKTARTPVPTQILPIKIPTNSQVGTVTLMATLYYPTPVVPPSDKKAVESDDEEAAASEADSHEAASENSTSENLAEETTPEKAPQYPLVLFVPMLDGSRNDWGDLPQMLMEKNIAVITLDLPGQGQSTRTAKKRTVSWRGYEGKDWLRYPASITQTLKYLAEKPPGSNLDFLNLDFSSVVVVGASIGANSAVLAAADNPGVRGLVLLSPGLAYKGLDITHVMLDLHRAMLFMVSDDDAQSAQPTQTLYRLAPGPKSLRVYKALGHGTDMLEVSDAPVRQDLLSFILKTLTPSVTKSATKPAEATAPKAKPAKSPHH